MQALQTQRAAFGSRSSSAARPQRAAVAPAALFGRKKPEPVVEAPPAKRGWFGRPAVEKEAPARKAAPAKKQVAAKPAPKKHVAKSASKAVVKDKAAEYEKRKGVFGRAVSAFDFAETRSKSGERRRRHRRRSRSHSHTEHTCISSIGCACACHASVSRAANGWIVAAWASPASNAHTARLLLPPLSHTASPPPLCQMPSCSTRPSTASAARTAR